MTGGPQAGIHKPRHRYEAPAGAGTIPVNETLLASPAPQEQGFSSTGHFLAPQGFKCKAKFYAITRAIHQSMGAFSVKF